MSRGPLALMDWKVPVTRQRFSRRDTAFYALSLGLGSDPLDRDVLKFVDPWHPELLALPSMALVLGYPGFWLGESKVAEATGIEPSRVLHVEQTVALAGPLPSEGEVLGATRVTAIVDKGVERGSLLYSERRIIDAVTGADLALCKQVHMLRNAGGFGSAGEVPPAGRDQTPQQPPQVTISRRILPQQALLYRLNGDANALHSDPAVAAEVGLSAPLLHGMCTIGIAVAGVVQALLAKDSRRVRGFAVRMTGAVHPGDTLDMDIWSDGSFRSRVAGRDSVVLDRGHVEFASD